MNFFTMNPKREENEKERLHPVFYPEGVAMEYQEDDMVEWFGIMEVEPTTEQERKENLDRVRRGESTKVFNMESSYVNPRIVRELAQAYPAIYFCFCDGGQNRGTGELVTKQGVTSPVFDNFPKTVKVIQELAEVYPIMTLNYTSYIQETDYRHSIPRSIGHPGLYAVDGLHYEGTDFATAMKWCALIDTVTERGITGPTTGVLSGDLGKLYRGQTEQKARGIEYVPASSFPDASPLVAPLEEIERAMGVQVGAKERQLLKQLATEGIEVTRVKCACGCQGRVVEKTIHVGHFFGAETIQAAMMAKALNIEVPVGGNQILFNPFLDYTIWQDSVRGEPMKSGQTHEYYHHFAMNYGATGSKRYRQLASGLGTKHRWIEMLEKIDYSRQPVSQWIQNLALTTPSLLPGIFAYEGVFFDLVEEDGSYFVEPPSEKRDSFKMRYYHAVKTQSRLKVHHNDRPLEKNFCHSRNATVIWHFYQNQFRHLREAVTRLEAEVMVEAKLVSGGTRTYFLHPLATWKEAFKILSCLGKLVYPTAFSSLGAYVTNVMVSGLIIDIRETVEVKDYGPSILVKAEDADLYDFAGIPVAVRQLQGAVEYVFLQSSVWC